MNAGWNFCCLFEPKEEFWWEFFMEQNSGFMGQRGHVLKLLLKSTRKGFFENKLQRVHSSVQRENEP